MNRWISVVDRIIVLIVGIALLAAGAYAIAWDAGASLIRTWVSRLDREVLFGLPEEPWWHWYCRAPSSSVSSPVSGCCT